MEQEKLADVCTNVEGQNGLLVVAEDTKPVISVLSASPSANV